VEEMYAAFGKDGPTADELDVAKKQMTTLLGEMMKTPDFWLGRLSSLGYRGTSLDDLLDAPAQYQQFTTAQGQGPFARYNRPDTGPRFVIPPRWHPAAGHAFVKSASGHATMPDEHPRPRLTPPRGPATPDRLPSSGHRSMWRETA